MSDSPMSVKAQRFTTFVEQLDFASKFAALNFTNMLWKDLEK